MTYEDNARHAGYTSIAEIVIDAPPAAVWPHVVDAASWIYDFEFERVAGEAGLEGETWHLWADGAEMPGGPLTIAPEDRTPENTLRLKVLTLVPGKLWYAVNPPKHAADGSVSTGVNVVTLTEIDGGTHVAAIRSKEVVAPTVAARDAAQREMHDLQPIPQRRWTDKYLPRLKQLVEESTA